MDIKTVLNSFTTIPDSIIIQFLKDNNIVIDYNIHQIALNLLSKNEQIIIPEIISDWVLA